MHLPPHLPVDPLDLATRFERLRGRGGWPERIIAQALAEKPETEGLGGVSLAPFLVLPTSGKMKSFASGEAFSYLKAGIALFVQANSWVWARYSRDCAYLRVTFEPNRWVVGHRLPKRRGGSLQLAVVTEPPGRFVEELLKRLGDPSVESADKAHVLHLLCAEVTGALRRQATRPSDVAVTRFAMIEQYLREHMNHPLDRGTCARAFGISVTHLSRLFSRHAGTTFQKRLEAFRLEQAERLLRTSGMSVADVAAACGYGSDSYFIRVFRSRHGASPAQWRQKPGN